MTSIPAWLIGKNVTTCQVAPITEGTGGEKIDTLADGGTTSLLLQLDEIGVEVVNNTEIISPLDERQDNHVIVSSDFTLTLTEILKRSGTNILANLYNGTASGKAYFTCTRGGQTFTFRGIMMRYNEGIRRGKSVGTLTLGRIATVATANTDDFTATGSQYYA